MKFCPNCGVKLDNDNFKFCPECGYKFGLDTNNSNTEKSGGFVSSFIKRVRDEIPDEYVDKIKDNETIDDAVTHAKIIWHGPQTEKEKAYAERKKQEKDKKKQELRDFRAEMKRKSKNQEDEIIDTKKVDEDIIQEVNNPTTNDKVVSEVKEVPEEPIVKEHVEEETEVKPVNEIEAEKPKEETSVKQTEEIDYSNLDLSDLQESLIKSLPVISNPSEYEENIIKKYAEFNSEERKELLKDCWTITKLAEEHNIKRQEVEKTILTDEFLEKDLIGLFKVNPNNIRSLKILYRKPLTKKHETEKSVTSGELIGEVKEISKEQIEKEIVEQPQKIEEEQVKTETQVVEEIVEDEAEAPQEVSIDETVVIDETVEEKVEIYQEENSNAPTNTIPDNKKDNNKKMGKRGLFSRKSSEEKEFEIKLKELCGGTFPNDAFEERAREHGTLTGVGGTAPANTNYKKVLKAEFKAGTLKIEDMENRLDELFELDVQTLDLKIRMKNKDTSVFKTQEDLNNLFGEDYAEKFRRKDKEYRKEALFEDYGINTEEAYCFECAIEERKSSTFTNTDRRNVDNAYIALFDDYIAIIKESVWLKSNMGMRKVFFKTVSSVDYDTSGKLGLSSSLFIHMHSGEHVQLKFITEKDADEIQKRFENYLAEKDTPNTVQIKQETSNADELLKYAELYKQGILTEEEFEAKKKELL
ncbi:SHOCT domain-containing protein [bacterium]|nr:SHOCT domain-containing protein [bacterium]